MKLELEYLCSSPLVICLGKGTLVSARAACSRTSYESRTRSVPTLPGSSSRPSPVFADDRNEMALDARATPAPPRIRARNCLRVVELPLEGATLEGAIGLARESKSFIF